VFNRPTPKSLFPPLSEKRLEQIATMYDVKDIGTSRIAGRMCRGITIAPRDQFRYGYELWADRETAVPLKVTLVDKARRGIEQMFFTEVDFPRAISDDAFEKDLPPEAIRAATNTAVSAITTAQASEPLVEPPAEPGPGFGKLPPGFRVVRHEVRALPDGGREDHFVLSDGMSAISVFRAIRRVETDQTGQRLDQMGAVNAYSRVVGTMHVTVVGEAPQQTVKMIGDNYQAISAETAAGIPEPPPPAPPPPPSAP
jgi:sigma-E factor negative regulatory protein RseB